MNVSKNSLIGSIVKIIANRIKSIILLRRITIKGNHMADNKKDLSEHDLKGKKLDISCYTAFLMALLTLSISFGNDVKKDSQPNTMRFASALCALGAGISGVCLIKGIKDYHKIKRELAKKASENTK